MALLPRAIDPRRHSDPCRKATL